MAWLARTRTPTTVYPPSTRRQPRDSRPSGKSSSEVMPTRMGSGQPAFSANSTARPSGSPPPARLKSYSVYSDAQMVNALVSPVAMSTQPIGLAGWRTATRKPTARNTKASASTAPSEDAVRLPVITVSTTEPTISARASPPSSQAASSAGDRPRATPDTPAGPLTAPLPGPLPRRARRPTTDRAAAHRAPRSADRRGPCPGRPRPAAGPRTRPPPRRRRTGPG